MACHRMCFCQGDRSCSVPIVVSVHNLHKDVMYKEQHVSFVENVPQVNSQVLGAGLLRTVSSSNFMCNLTV